MITKGDIVDVAYAEIRISGLTKIANGDEIAYAIRRMDSMVALWQSYHICMGYIPSIDGVIEPTQDSGITEKEFEAIALNLAPKLAPKFGKKVDPNTLVSAKHAYDSLFSTELTLRESTPYQPTGSGHSFGYFYRDRFRFQAFDKNAPTECSTLDIKVGETKTFIIDLSSQVPTGQTILSYVLDDGEGLKVLSHSRNENVFTLQCEASVEGYAIVKITLTLDPSTDINPVSIDFNITEESTILCL